MPPKVNAELAPQIFHKLHEAICQGLIRSCHDLSEGGLAVAMAEMCLAGGWGATIDLSFVSDSSLGDLDREVALFAESNTRFLIEVQQENETEVTRLLSNSYKLIGAVTEDPYLRVTSGKEKELAISVSIADLKEAWQKPLRW